jgi:hypothetical protein
MVKIEKDENNKTPLTISFSIPISLFERVPDLKLRMHGPKVKEFM